MVDSGRGSRKRRPAQPAHQPDHATHQHDQQHDWNQGNQHHGRSTTHRRHLSTDFNLRIAVQAAAEYGNIPVDVSSVRQSHIAAERGYVTRNLCPMPHTVSPTARGGWRPRVLGSIAE
jgi:hypothetical protein